MLGENTLVQNRYLVRNLIGRGGMGAIYLAEDRRFNNRILALKELLYLNNSKVETAFGREANLLAQLHHPRLPKVSDYFNENGCQYLVMEYVSGEDLDTLLKRNGKSFPLNRVLNWADSLLDILEYLHIQNPPVIHRDIKPQNLKLNNEDKIILLDFGLAKDTQTPLSELARSKSLVGFTPNFAPLEQIRGDRTTIQTDLYSFSATIYNLLTNTAPASSLNRVQAKINETPDPLIPAHQLNPEIPVKLSQLLMYGLTLKQEGRPHSASEMRRMIKEILNEQKDLREMPTQHFNYNQTPVIEETVKSFSFPPPTQIFPAKSLSYVEPPTLGFSPPKKSENRSSIILFGVLVGVLGVGIIATFFVGQWISTKMNPTTKVPETKTEMQEGNKTQTTQTATTGNNNNTAGNTTTANVTKPENKTVAETKTVPQKKPSTKPVAPKPVQKKPSTQSPPAKDDGIFQ